MGDGGRAGRDVRLWGRINARIEPEWVERARTAPGQAQLQRAALGEEARRGDGLEKVTLYGVPIVARPQGQLRHASTATCRASCSSATRSWRVSGRRTTASSTRTEACSHEAEELEHRARRRDIVVDEETLFDFYDQRVPAEVVSSARHFDSWWKVARRDQPDLLTFDEDMLRHRDGRAVTRGAVPDQLAAGRPDAARSPTSSSRERPPTVSRSTSRSPCSTRSTDNGFDWQVPGLRQDLVTALAALACPRRCGATSYPLPTTPATSLNASIQMTAVNLSSTRCLVSCAAERE